MLFCLVFYNKTWTVIYSSPSMPWLDCLEKFNSGDKRVCNSNKLFFQHISCAVIKGSAAVAQDEYTVRDFSFKLYKWWFHHCWTHLEPLLAISSAFQPVCLHANMLTNSCYIHVWYHSITLWKLNDHPVFTVCWVSLSPWWGNHCFRLPIWQRQTDSKLLIRSPSMQSADLGHTVSAIPSIASVLTNLETLMDYIYCSSALSYILLGLP